MSASPVGMSSDGRDPREIAWDRYWSEVYHPGSFQPGGFTRWAIPFLRKARARQVVDLGCGPGRDLCFLLEHGYFVTGVDSSSVAVSLAEKALLRLPLEARARSTLVRAELFEFLRSRGTASVDAVHSSATYQDLSEGEMAQIFHEVGRILSPGGLHLWSVRTERHFGRAHPETVPPNFRGLGFTVPLRFFSGEDITRLTGNLFESVALDEVETAPGFFACYVADRKSRS